ncbi:MAG: dihydroorotate dehydrogenase (quinone), partial [Gammaproteobacteria bacterium]
PLPTKAFGLTFENPVGLAAGMDKNGAHIDALAQLGFGFIEVGTVTPRPQAGNPQPRLFRIPQKQAIINRMGFNNDGVGALVGNLERTRWKGVIGVNIGKNKDTPNDSALRDYLYCLERVWSGAGYIVINISSPNTAGLRELQHGDPLRAHLDPTIPIIGVGGILSGADAVGKLSAGAHLVQCYSGLIYRGPGLVGECVEAIRRRREQGVRRG